MAILQQEGGYPHQQPQYNIKLKARSPLNMQMGAKGNISNAQPPSTTKTMYNIYFVGM
jgi:hypothetical protein